jgi:hypothetical protein
MDNQHSQAEIDLMNRIKAHAELTRQLIEDVMTVVAPEPVLVALDDDGMATLLAELNETRSQPMELMQGEALLRTGGHQAGPSRWVDLADDHLQQGFMALTRAVAQPTTY